MRAEANHHHGDGKGHGKGAAAELVGHHVNGHALARRVEANVVTEYSHLWKRMFGWAPADHEGPGFGIDDDSEVAAARKNFRQTVRGVMEEWASAVRRLDELDQAVEKHLKRKPVLVMKEVNGDGSGPDPSLISGPAELRDLSRELADKARGIGSLIDAVSAIAPDLARGRMQPEEDRGARNNQVFEQSWNDHLRDLRQNFGPVAVEAGRIAEEMTQADREGARAIRALFRNED